MSTNFGKPLTKKEMKEIQGGKLPGCGSLGQNGVSYSQGCCTGLSQCPGTHLCEYPSNSCFGVA
ncbi:class IIb bacteriocin, lactobin A/cerein 7B family [Mucilaginibacter sp.]|uniref:class IIb bacteriocin, lactobin A/cerein 7B family n=1 Tax=Mucilaginibacter sp. TaxID=1882438 RepID=UPI003D14037A